MAEATLPGFSELIKRYNKVAHLVVLNGVSGETLLEYRADELVKPASVMKVVTSAAALRTLGSEFRFRTSLLSPGYTAGDKKVKDLYLRGGGDPSFTIESLWMVVRKMKTLGIEGVGAIYLDGSLFKGQEPPQGQRAYEAGSSPLSFNFNSIAFSICPTQAGRDALIGSDPYEIKVLREGSIRSLKGGGGVFQVDQLGGSDLRFRFSGSIGANDGCQTIYRSVPDPAVYFGTTFLELLADNGIAAPKEVRMATTPKGAEAIFDWQSKPLSLVVGDLNNFSNNMIAEQVLFALGGDGPVWRREVGLERMRDYLKGIGFSKNGVQIVDGSGLSHENLVTTRMIATVLLDMARTPGTSPEFKASLPVGGKTGTLKDRPLDLSSAVLRAKTGSLTGVSSLAGYLDTVKGRSYVFAIISNGVGSRSEAHRFEDEFVRRLATL